MALQAGIQANEALRARLSELEQQAREIKHVGESDDGKVRAVVDRGGALVSLEIAPDSFWQAHPQRVGDGVVTAVSRARAAADAVDAEIAALARAERGYNR